MSTEDANTVPEAVVTAAMAEFEAAYNADDTPRAAAYYAPQCDVKVNEGSVFAGTTPAACAAFLGKLRNELGGTNIKFTVSKVEGNKHWDSWTADNGTGTCEATWAKVGDDWKMVADKISFTPKQQ